MTGFYVVEMHAGMSHIASSYILSPFTVTLSSEPSGKTHTSARILIRNGCLSQRIVADMVQPKQKENTHLLPRPKKRKKSLQSSRNQQPHAKKREHKVLAASQRSPLLTLSRSSSAIAIWPTCPTVEMQTRKRFTIRSWTLATSRAANEPWPLDVDNVSSFPRTCREFKQTKSLEAPRRRRTVG